jgi:hypothetical protein
LFQFRSSFVPVSFHFRSHLFVLVPIPFVFVRFCSGIGRVARRCAHSGVRRESVFSMGECRGNEIALILEAQGIGEHPLKRCVWPGKGKGRRQEFGRKSRALEQGGGKQGRCTDSHRESGKGAIATATACGSWGPEP